MGGGESLATIIMSPWRELLADTWSVPSRATPQNGSQWLCSRALFAEVLGAAFGQKKLSKRGSRRFAYSQASSLLVDEFIDGRVEAVWGRVRETTRKS